MKLSPVWRVTVHVPEAHVRRLIDGIRAVDDLRIGAYADVLWISAPGIEQFRPLEGAQPALGTIGERVRSNHVCVSFGIPRDEARLARLLDAIRANHPWEVPAVFVDESLSPLP